MSPPQQPDGTDSRTAADARIAQAYRDGMARFEWVHRRVDGTDFDADVLLARVDLQERSIIQAVVRDITERKRVEHALREAQEQLEQRVQRRTAALAAANEELQREVAERRRVEEELAFERFLLTTLMQHAPDFIYFKDDAQPVPPHQPGAGGVLWPGGPGAGRSASRTTTSSMRRAPSSIARMNRRSCGPAR